VKHLPVGSTLWYTGNGDITRTNSLQLNHTTKLYNEEWATGWSNKDEVLVVKGDFEQWLRADIDYLISLSGWYGIFSNNPATAIDTDSGTTSFSYNATSSGATYTPIIWSKQVTTPSNKYMNSVDCLYAEVSNAGINQYT